MPADLILHNAKIATNHVPPFVQAVAVQGGKILARGTDGEMLGQRGPATLVIDASGDPSEMASRTSLARFTQAGIIPTCANAVICEVHRTWNRPDAAQLAEPYTMVSPNYRALMESYRKAQEVAKK